MTVFEVQHEHNFETLSQSKAAHANIIQHISGKFSQKSEQLIKLTTITVSEPGFSVIRTSLHPEDYWETTDLCPFNILWHNFIISAITKVKSNKI